MRRRPASLSLLLLVLCTGCGDSSSGNFDLPPAAIWGQFRQNNRNTAFGVGISQSKDAIVDMEFVDEITPEDPFPSAISSSPAIDADGRLYIASEGGTLASFDGADDLNRLWSVNRCNQCPVGNRSLGPLISSPAVYTYEDFNNKTTFTNVFLGSMDGAVFMYTFDEDDPFVDPDDCQVCFWRGNPLLQNGFIASDPGATANATFASSPTFSVNLGTGSIAGIFIGATITIEHTDGSIETQGKLYAINQNGSLRWEFPRPGDPPIAPVSSSPAFAIGQNIFFTTDEDPNSSAPGDMLYALTEAGNLKRIISIEGLTDPSLLFSPSPMSSATVFVGTVDGAIHAMNPDGTFRWNATIPGERFATSLAVGGQNVPTETASPEPTPTPTGTRLEPSATETPTATLTPLRIDSNVLGITESGKLVILDSGTGDIISPTGQMPSVPVEGSVVSSPALSADLFIFFGTTAGQLFSLNTANAQFPRFCDGGENDGFLCTDDVDCPDGFCEESSWPILLPLSCDSGEQRSQLCTTDDDCPGGACVRPAIRSSPTLDLDGTIYFGADDGRVYAVDVEATPTGTPSPEGTITPPASPTAPPTREVEPSATPTPEATPSSEPTPTVEATPTAEVLPTETTALPPSPTPTADVTAEPTPPGAS